jgi:hypothetical protein
MLKNMASICAALILAVAAFSAPAQARGGAHFGGGGAHFGGAHFGGARVVGVGGRYYGRGAGLAWRGGVYRGGRYAYGYRGGRYGYGHGRYGYGYRGYWPYVGWGVAAGALAVAWPYDYGYGYGDYSYGDETPAYDSGVAYCMQRFRTYDPASGTYIGNDGYPHPCP